MLPGGRYDWSLSQTRKCVGLGGGMQVAQRRGGGIMRLAEMEKYAKIMREKAGKCRKFAKIMRSFPKAERLRKF